MLTSCAQFVFTTLGATTSSGKALAAWAASSACAVLPRPGSSASRNVRWPAAVAATTCAWCGMSSRPCGACTGRVSGSRMQAGDPSAAYSKDRNSGSSSSQPASRRGRVATRSAAASKSGARNGLASWRAMTERGTTLVSVPGAGAGGATGSGSGGGSRPPARITVAL